MNNQFLLLLFLSFGLMINSCEKGDSSDGDTETASEYYPFEEGAYFVYEVDSISLEAGLNLNDTVNFQIKEVHDSLYENTNGDTVMRLRRFKRLNEDEPWVISDVWTAERTSFNVQRVEENVRKICLGLPISEDNSWNVNALNIFDPWQASYERIGESVSLENFDFDKTITVEFEDNFNLIERESAAKIFAEDIGMVSSRETILKFNEFIPLDQNPSPEQIELGRILNYTLIEYGTE